MPGTSFLGLDFDALTEAEVERWLASRSAESPYAYVVTPNVDHMVRIAKGPPELNRLYIDADLCVCDSRVLAMLARSVGVHLSVVPGSDLVETLFNKVLKPSDRVCLIGGSQNAAKMLSEKFPNICFFQHSPPMGLISDTAARAAAIEFAAKAKARYTLLAVGSPQQELLAWEMRQSGIKQGTALCIGAAVDFLLETQRRAPRFIRRVGAEWAWRLLTQPRRLARRYLIDGPAIFAMVWNWSQARRSEKK